MIFRRESTGSKPPTSKPSFSPAADHDIRKHSVVLFDGRTTLRKSPLSQTKERAVASAGCWLGVNLRRWIQLDAHLFPSQADISSRHRNRRL
jgi:hypothetical protein